MARLNLGWLDLLRASTTSLTLLLTRFAVLAQLVTPLEFILIVLATKAVPLSLIVPVVLVTIIIVIFGRFFCGWMCPVGTLLHYFHLFTNKGEKKRVGGLWRNREKYVILLAVLAAGLIFEITATYLFSPPRIVYSALVHLTVLGIIGADILVLVVILVLDILAMRYDRTWCDTLCPLGGMISGLSIINLFKPRINYDTCIDFDFNCLNCERVCPMRIPITRADRWTMMECNKCMRCLTNCPVNAVKIDILGGK